MGKYSRIGAILLCLAFPVTALAVPTLQGPANAATGISGLDIGGVIYDVTFSNWGSFDALGENPPTFLGDQAGAQAAEAAIASFLNGIAFGITNLPLGRQDLILIPYFLDATSFGAEAVASSDPTTGIWVTTSGTAGSRTANFGNVSWTSFSTAVPEPGTLALMALGLAGIGYRRKKSA